MSNPYQEHFKKTKKIKPSAKKKVTLPKKEESKKSSLKTVDDLRTELAARKNQRKQVRRKNEKQPIQLLISLGLGAVLCSLGLLYTDKIDSFISRVDIGMFGLAEAKEEKSASTNSPEEEKVAPVKKSNKTVENINWTPEQINNFNKLRERKLELDAREKELAKLEEELQQQKGEIEKRIQELARMRQEIAKVLESKVEIDEEKITKLVDFYSNMKPASAAQVIQDLDEDLAVEILGKMKKKNAANIMNLLKPEKAQKLTEKFAGYMR